MVNFSYSLEMKYSLFTLAFLHVSFSLCAQSLWEKIQSLPEISIFSEAIKGTLYDEEYLNKPDSFLTVFAPSNAAIEALAPEIWRKLQGDSTQRFSDWVGYHIAEDIYADSIADEAVYILSDNSVLNSLIQEPLLITIDSIGGVRVNGAFLIEKNIWAGNGIIHIIDSVLIPDTLLSILTHRKSLLAESVGIHVFPNPTANSIEIELPPSVDLQEGVSFELINREGKCILSREMKAYKDWIDLSSWSKGEYLLLFHLGDSYAYERLMLK